jgi:hypothetical protein
MTAFVTGKQEISVFGNRNTTKNGNNSTVIGQRRRSCDEINQALGLRQQTEGSNQNR